MTTLNFTKNWDNTDNGTIPDGQDLGDIQNDLVTWSTTIGDDNISSAGLGRSSLAVATRPSVFWHDNVDGLSSYISTGFDYSSASGLDATFNSGRGYTIRTDTDPDEFVQTRVTTQQVITLTASSDNYIDLKHDGTLQKVVVSTGSAEPSVSADSQRIALLTTNGTTVSANTDKRNLLKPFGQVSGFKNKIINGNFDIWQRGTSFAAIANGAYSADRYRFTVSGSTAVHTVSRSTDVPTVAESGRHSNYSLLIDCTTADTSIAAGDLVGIQQRIEGFNWSTLAQRPFTISFWVKATKTGIYCVSFGNSGTDRSYVAEYTVNTTDTWEKKTVTVSASPSAGTWDYTTGVGLRVFWALASGTTFHASAANTWETGDFLATANQVNALDSTSNDFRIAQVQVEAGNVATEFEKVDIGTEEERCFRYYRRYTNPSANEPYFIGYNESTTEQRAVVTFDPPLRGIPSLETSGTASDYNIGHAGASTNANAVPILSAPQVHGTRVRTTVASGLTAGQGSELRSGSAATASFLGFNAEL